MLKVAINGYLGAMGQVLAEEISKDEELKLVAGIDRNYNKNIKTKDIKVYNNVHELTEHVDMIIDFSHPNSLNDLLDYCIEKNISLVIGTTGLKDEDMEKIKKGSEKTAIFYSANMSLGINLLLSLVAKTAKVLGDNFDIEIIEKHHNQKIDAPSGTAYMIADKINETLDNSKKYIYERHSRNEKRAKTEIGIHSIRGGTIVGEHSAIFAGPDEVVEICHNASSKAVFAQGAIKASKFISKKEKGFYNMDDLINS